MREIEMALEKSEEVTPRRFLSVLEERADDIERVRIRAPRLGRGGFGRVVVDYRRGVFRPAGLAGAG